MRHTENMMARLREGLQRYPAAGTKADKSAKPDAAACGGGTPKKISVEVAGS